MDYERHKRKVIAVNAVFMSVFSVLVAVRVWYRAVKRNTWGLDDCEILLLHEHCA
jgi:hypothetical protein